MGFTHAYSSNPSVKNKKKKVDRNYNVIQHIQTCGGYLINILFILHTTKKMIRKKKIRQYTSIVCHTNKMK